MAGEFDRPFAMTTVGTEAGVRLCFRPKRSVSCFSILALPVRSHGGRCAEAHASSRRSCWVLVLQGSAGRDQTKLEEGADRTDNRRHRLLQAVRVSERDAVPPETRQWTISLPRELSSVMTASDGYQDAYRKPGAAFFGCCGETTEATAGGLTRTHAVPRTPPGTLLRTEQTTAWSGASAIRTGMQSRGVCRNRLSGASSGARHRP